MFTPAYIKTLESGLFPEKIDRARKRMEDCVVCPRECRVNRLRGETGFCQIADRAMVSSANPHFGEETPLVGTGGSGTIFMTSCNLKCSFCQNFEISRLNEGREVGAAQLADMMLALERIGCHNINFVTPSHVSPQIIEAVEMAAANGLQVPLVYNSGGYDSVETLHILDGIFDIYMPDLKFMDSAVSARFMDAPDYPDRARAALKEMHRQVGDLEIDERNIATRGLVVRHLVMPNDLAQTREAMRFLADEISTNTYVNIMNQYRPCGEAVDHPEIGRSVTPQEFARALEAAQEEGITRLDDRVAFRLRFF